MGTFRVTLNERVVDALLALGEWNEIFFDVIDFLNSINSQRVENCIEVHQSPLGSRVRQQKIFQFAFNQKTGIVGDRTEDDAHQFLLHQLLLASLLRQLGSD